MAKKKPSAPKKATAKKKSAPPMETESLPPVGGIPCICVKANGRWFCMKEDKGELIQCDGPFATKSECEEHFCI
jgi:hypothetical protein